MQQTTKSSLIGLGISTLLLLVSLGLYSARTQTLTEDTKSSVRFANSLTLHDWAPRSVTESALQHIEYYLATNTPPGSLVTISTTPRYGDDGSLSFEFKADNSATINTLTVQSINYGGGIVSNAVTINGDDSVYKPVTKLYDASFEDFNNLVEYGLTGGQVYEIQKLLRDYDTTGHFAIETGSIKQAPTDSNTKTTVGLVINGNHYRLVNDSSGIDNVHVRLYDKKTKQVLDSGLVAMSY